MCHVIKILLLQYRKFLIIDMYHTSMMNILFVFQVLGVLAQDGIMRFINVHSCKLLFQVGSHDQVDLEDNMYVFSWVSTLWLSLKVTERFRVFWWLNDVKSPLLWTLWTLDITCVIHVHKHTYASMQTRYIYISVVLVN